MTINDSNWQFLHDATGLSLPYNDMYFRYLRDLGYEGTLQDMIAASEFGMNPSETGVVLQSESVSLANRFTTYPTPPRMVLINNLITSLKSDGVWAKLDALYLTAASDSQASRQNWIANQYNLTAVSSPTFTADRGYAGNGSSSYLTSGFNPATAGGKFVLNSASLFAWLRTSVDATTKHFAGNNTAKIGRNADGTSLRSQANDGTGTFSATAALTGLVGFSRQVAGSYATYRNGALLGSPAVAATLVSSVSLDFCRSSEGSYSASQIACGFFGSGLTAGEVLAAYNALNTYLTAVGAA